MTYRFWSYAVGVGAIEFLAVTKIDTLERLGVSFFVEKYNIGDKTTQDFFPIVDLENIQTVFRELKTSDIKNIIEDPIGVRNVIRVRRKSKTRRTSWHTLPVDLFCRVIIRVSLKPRGGVFGYVSSKHLVRVFSK